MRLLFDAFWWATGPIANRTVQREIILAWARQFPEDELVLALRKGAAPEGLPAAASSVRTTLWPHALANRLQLPALARSLQADATVVHNYTPRRGATAVFIHDAMFVDHPEWFSRAERVYFAPMLPWARRAAVVATSTQTEADRIRRHGRRMANPIATGLGVPPAITQAQPLRPAALGEVDGFAMTVGRLNVRKNLETIMEAAAFMTKLGPRSPLVVVGGTEHSGVAPTFSDEVRRSIDQGRIVLLGGIGDAELAWLYANTSVAITLSRDEGFGLPAIEAAAFGAPLVASDIPVFRETVGDYAHFVSPDAPAGIIAAEIDAAWGKPSDGRVVLSRYSWDGAAATLRAALIDAL